MHEHLLAAPYYRSTTFFLTGLIAGIIFAFICERVATRKGHNPVLWAVLGFFFTLIALIIIAVLPARDRRPA